MSANIVVIGWILAAIVWGFNLGHSIAKREKWLAEANLVFIAVVSAIAAVLR